MTTAAPPFDPFVHPSRHDDDDAQMICALRKKPKNQKKDAKRSTDRQLNFTSMVGTSNAVHSDVHARTSLPQYTTWPRVEIADTTRTSPTQGCSATMKTTSVHF